MHIPVHLPVQFLAHFSAHFPVHFLVHFPVPPEAAVAAAWKAATGLRLAAVFDVAAVAAATGAGLRLFTAVAAAGRAWMLLAPPAAAALGAHLGATWIPRASTL